MDFDGFKRKTQETITVPEIFGSVGRQTTGWRRESFERREGRQSGGDVKFLGIKRFAYFLNN